MKYTINDLANGKVAVKNDGTPEQLRRVKELAAPLDCYAMTFSANVYYVARNTWMAIDQTILPTQSVKDFL